MTSPHFFLNKPQKFKDICYIYPPTVSEVIDEKNFSVWINTFELDQYELDDEFSKETVVDENGNLVKPPTPFEYLLINAYNSNDFDKLIRTGFKFFIKEEVTFLYDYPAIFIGDLSEELELSNGKPENLRLITEDNYFDFQNMIRESVGHSKIDPPEDLSQLDPRIARFKKKARERDRVKAKQEAKKAPTLATTLASICCMGIGLTPLNIGEISYAAVSKLIETNQKHEKYDLDCRSLLMGADAKKINFEYWIRN